MGRYIEYNEWMRTAEGMEFGSNWNALQKTLVKEGVKYHSEGNKIMIERHGLNDINDKHNDSRVTAHQLRMANSQISGARRSVIHKNLVTALKGLDEDLQRKIIEQMNNNMGGYEADKLRYSEIAYFSHINPKTVEYMDSLYTGASETPNNYTINPEPPGSKTRPINGQPAAQQASQLASQQAAQLAAQQAAQQQANNP